MGKTLEARIAFLENLKSALPAAKLTTFHQHQDKNGNYTGKFTVDGTDLLFSKKERDKFIQRQKKKHGKKNRIVVPIVMGKRGPRSPDIDPPYPPKNH